MSHPMVSVVIPVWNCSRYIRSTLDSVLDQDWPQVEVIAVDDGSTDETPSILAEYRDRISVVTISNSGGPSRPRNTGIARANGEFISLFDSDDIMEPGKLSAAMDVFRDHPETGFCFSAFRAIDEEDEVVKNDWLEDYRGFREYCTPGNRPEVGLIEGGRVFEQLIRANFIGTSSVVARKEIMKTAGPFDESMKNSDDIEMWFRLARKDIKFAFLDRVLHSYRLNKSGITYRGLARYPAVIYGLEKQLPHCRRPEDLALLKRRIRNNYMGQAWGHRRNGDIEAAEASFRKSLALGWTRPAIMGILRNRLTRFVRFLGFPR